MPPSRSRFNICATNSPRVARLSCGSPSAISSRVHASASPTSPPAAGIAANGSGRSARCRAIQRRPVAPRANTRSSPAWRNAATSAADSSAADSVASPVSLQLAVSSLSVTFARSVKRRSVMSRSGSSSVAHSASTSSPSATSQSSASTRPCGLWQPARRISAGPSVRTSCESCPCRNLRASGPRAASRPRPGSRYLRIVVPITLRLVLHGL